MDKNDKSVPQHIVLFPDGNRRWAKEQGLDTLEGHLKGLENFEGLLLWCKSRGVKIITVFGFSSENWNRSQEEVNYLMDLFEKYLSDKSTIEKFQEEGIRVKIIGQKERLKPSLQQIIVNIEEKTKQNSTFHLNLAVSYGGKWDIMQATKNIVKENIPVDEITEETIASHLSTSGFPDPDLIIRVGGEKRLSNFVLWQAAYAELYFSPKYWPTFTEQDFDEALEEYARRQRRFGH